MTVRFRISTALILSLVFLGGLIAYAPASLFNALLGLVSGGQLRLAQTQGSIWRGSGAVLLGHSSGYLLLGNYHWNFEPWHMTFYLRNEDGSTAIFYLDPLKRELVIENLQAKFPAAALEHLFNHLRIYQLQGTIYMYAMRLTLDITGAKGQIMLKWQDAYSGLSLVRPLGNYRVLLRCNGKKIDTKLTTISGRLILEAVGSYAAKSGLQIHGTARATPGSTAALNELLHHIGPEISSGLFEFVLIN